LSAKLPQQEPLNFNILITELRTKTAELNTKSDNSLEQICTSLHNFSNSISDEKIKKTKYIAQLENSKKKEKLTHIKDAKQNIDDLYKFTEHLILLVQQFITENKVKSSENANNVKSFAEKLADNCMDEFFSSKMILIVRTINHYFSKATDITPTPSSTTYIRAALTHDSSFQSRISTTQNAEVASGSQYFVSSSAPTNVSLCTPRLTYGGNNSAPSVTPLDNIEAISPFSFFN
jgi:hypothetical protein